MSSYVVGKRTSRESESLSDESMLTPLLSDEEASVDSDGGLSQDSDASMRAETIKQTPMQIIKSLAVYVGLCAGIAASAAAIALAPSIVVFIMGGICIANIPCAVLKERQIGKLQSLRDMNIMLREDAKMLEEQAEILSEAIVYLEPEAGRAAVVANELRDIAQRLDVDENTLVDLVKENEGILSQMRDNLRQRIVHDMITIVAKSNKSSSETFDNSEAKILALMIHISLQVYGVDFDSDKFLKVMGEDATLQRVFGILQRLLPANNNGQTENAGSHHSDWDEEMDDEDDLYDMFHMKEESGKVSVLKCDKKNYTSRVR